MNAGRLSDVRRIAVADARTVSPVGWEEERLIDFTMITSAEKESIKINREYRARLVKG